MNHTVGGCAGGNELSQNYTSNRKVTTLGLVGVEFFLRMTAPTTNLNEKRSPVDQLLKWALSLNNFISPCPCKVCASDKKIQLHQ